MAAEKKRGLADLELLCQELEKCDKKKEGKRERKRNRRARKKELKNAVLAKISASDESKHGSDGESNSGDSGVSVDNKDNVIDDNKDHVIETQNNKIKSSASPEICSKFTKCTLTLEEMLGEDFEDDLDEDEDLIPAEEIKKFLDKSEDMAVRRQQLRDNLKMRFAQFCDNAVYSVRQ